MVVFITGAVAFFRHQFGRRVQDMFGRHQGTGFLCAVPCRAIRLVNGVGFGGGRHVNQRFGQRQLAFRAAHALIRLPCRDRQRQGLRIGKTDILARHPCDTAGDEARVLATREHPRKPVQRRVSIAAADAFMERAD